MVVVVLYPWQPAELHLAAGQLLNGVDESMGWSMYVTLPYRRLPRGRGGLQVLLMVGVVPPPVAYYYRFSRNGGNLSLGPEVVVMAPQMR